MPTSGATRGKDMYLAGFNIQIGNFLALKVVMGKESSHDARNKHFGFKKDSCTSSCTPYAEVHSPLELSNNHMLTYNSRGTSSISDIPPGSHLKIYI